jgi:hypothetical protein
MTATSRGRVAIAVLIAALAFGAAFAVRKATAGAVHAPAMPAPLVLRSTSVRVTGVTLAPAALPVLRHAPHPVAPAQSAAPSSTPVAPAQSTPSPAPAPAAPSQPAAPSGGGKGGGPVLVG